MESYLFNLCAYPLHTGTVYYQENTPLLIMSGFSVYSLASSLFLFPALYLYFARALEIYTFEHADGAGRAYDLVIQPFIRFVSMSFFPVVLCGAVLYVLVGCSCSCSFCLISCHNLPFTDGRQTSLGLPGISAGCADEYSPHSSLDSFSDVDNSSISKESVSSLSHHCFCYRIHCWFLHTNQ